MSDQTEADVRRFAKDAADVQTKWLAAEARAEAAEAEVRDLRAKVAAVEALADKEDARVAEVNARLATREPEPKTGRPISIVGILTTAEIRAALASEVRTEPESSQKLALRIADEYAASQAAKVGRTEPAPEAGRSGHPGCDFDATPAFTRYSGTAGSKVDAALGGGE